MLRKGCKERAHKSFLIRQSLFLPETNSQRQRSTLRKLNHIQTFVWGRVGKSCGWRDSRGHGQCRSHTEHTQLPAPHQAWVWQTQNICRQQAALLFEEPQPSPVICLSKWPLLLLSILNVSTQILYSSPLVIKSCNSSSCKCQLSSLLEPQKLASLHIPVPATVVLQKVCAYFKYRLLFFTAQRKNKKYIIWQIFIGND